MADQQPIQSNPVLSYYQDWASRTPYVTRCCMIGMLSFYILSFFFKTDLILGNQAYYTVMKLEIYRLVLSPLVGNSIINMILIAIFFPEMGARIEYNIGSAGFLSLIGLLTLAVNTSFALFCISMFYAGSHVALFWSCAGFWTVLFALITIECLQLPDAPRRMMFIPMDIPSKFFPLIMFIIFSLFTGPQLDMAVSMVIGFAYSKGYFDKFKITPAYLERSESSGVLTYFRNNPGWILTSGALGNTSWSQQQVARDAQEEKSQSGSGGGSVYSAGNNRSSETKAEQPKNQFPGSGHKLTPTSMTSWIPTAGTTATAPSARDIAARRLAALQRQSLADQTTTAYDVTKPGVDKAGAVTGANAVHGEEALTQLMEMGYARADAARALAMSDGSLFGATQILTT